MNPEVLKIANEPGMWIAVSAVVAIVWVQTILYIRQALKAADSIGLSRVDCMKGLRVGIISAIGPSIAVVIVAIGMMGVVGGPSTWQRLSIIGAAQTELTASTVGAQAYGVEFGSAQYDLNAFATSVWTMAINGIGWLAFCLLFTDKLEIMRDKLGGGDPKWLAALSSAAMLGAFAYLTHTHILAGGPSLAAVISAGLTMILVSLIAQKLKALREYSLGIAMIIGMVIAVIFI